MSTEKIIVKEFSSLSAGKTLVEAGAYTFAIFDFNLSKKKPLLKIITMREENFTDLLGWVENEYITPQKTREFTAKIQAKEFILQLNSVYEKENVSLV